MDRKMSDEVDRILRSFKDDEAPEQAAAAVGALMSASSPDEWAERLRTCRAWIFVAASYMVEPPVGLATLAGMVGAAYSGQEGGEASSLAAVEVRKEIAPALSRVGKALLRGV